MDMLNDEQINHHLDAILRASGSALRHYTMQGTLDAMRSAMRDAVEAAAREEREACAKVCDAQIISSYGSRGAHAEIHGIEWAARAIRARGLEGPSGELGAPSDQSDRVHQPQPNTAAGDVVEDLKPRMVPTDDKLELAYNSVCSWGYANKAEHHLAGLRAVADAAVQEAHGVIAPAGWSFTPVEVDAITISSPKGKTITVGRKERHAIRSILFELAELMLSTPEKGERKDGSTP